MPEDKKITIDPRYGRPLKPEEVAPSFAVPGISANTFVVQPMDMGVRIAFGEQAPNTSTTYFRFAAILSNWDAVQLYRVLKDTLSAYEDTVAATEQQSEAAGRWLMRLFLALSLVRKLFGRHLATSNRGNLRVDAAAYQFQQKTLGFPWEAIAKRA